MKLIIGIGNPGEKYRNNRHNVGHILLDKFVEQIQNSKIKNQNYNLKFKIDRKFQSEILVIGNLMFAKPITYMNNSGIAVEKLISQYNIKTSDLWVIHDDLDIPLGSYKIQKGKGPKDHKGLLSIYEKLGSKDFWHVRVGVDNRPKIPNPNDKIQRISGETYVLQDFTEEEREVLDKIISEVCKKLTNRLIV